MTTNRPFFSHFLSAFRARSGVQKASSSANGGAVSGASLSAYAQAKTQSQLHTQSTSPATPIDSTIQSKPIPTTSLSSSLKEQHTSSTAINVPSPGAVASFSPRPHHHTHHPTRTHHHVHHHLPKAIEPPQPPLSRSPGSSTTSTQHASPFGSYPRQRRESDSSSEGFREVLGADKWYIGGRTAAGEERFYKLGLVRRPRSLDRVSLDRLSL
jgi:hypothetical protein